MLWPGVGSWLPLVRGNHIRGLRRVRRRARRLVRAAAGPVLVCANHLTWVDSLLVQWVLGGPLAALGGSRWLLWNLPERRNFCRRPWMRAACYLGRCLPIERGGDRSEQRRVLARARWLLAAGDLVLIFPEGGRSRSGRVEMSSITYGVGSLAASLPRCSVLCVYLRGQRQDGPTVLPAPGERFDVDFELFQPRAQGSSLRRARSIALSIGARLVELERRYYARASVSARSGRPRGRAALGRG
ncbi:MAG: 1-acyl-sn-glycerol-3-phosphate acyltransferase [Candidatus Dadabacteria bacterium]|nr:MAG: 1-acyl-sn-glycerol-3-phosphate acyltransferase [Candidatus Dadabacteria bacterium]